MGLLTGRQPLLERQPLVLLGVLRLGAGGCKLVQRLAMQSGLLRELPTVAPVLELPSAAEAGKHQHHHADQPPRHSHASTARAFFHSASRSAKPFRPPLIRRVMVLNSSRSAKSFRPFCFQNHAADIAAC